MWDQVNQGRKRFDKAVDKDALDLAKANNTIAVEECVKSCS